MQSEEINNIKEIELEKNKYMIYVEKILSNLNNTLDKIWLKHNYTILFIHCIERQNYNCLENIKFIQKQLCNCHNYTIEYNLEDIKKYEENRICERICEKKQLDMLMESVSTICYKNNNI